MRRVLWIVYIGLLLIVIALNKPVEGTSELAATAFAALIGAFCLCLFVPAYLRIRRGWMIKRNIKRPWNKCLAP